MIIIRYKMVWRVVEGCGGVENEPSTREI